MRTVELRSLSFPDLETRKIENQNTRGIEETGDFIAILQSVQKDTSPYEEIQTRQDSEPPKKEEPPVSESPQASPGRDIVESPTEEERIEELALEESEDSIHENPDKPKLEGDLKARGAQTAEIALPEEEVSLPTPSEVNNTLQSGFSLVSILNPKSEVEHKEEIFQNRISSPSREPLLSPKEKFPGEEKKETNELLKSMFVEKNSKQKQEEKPQQSKVSEESPKAPIVSARSLVEEWKQQTQGILKVEDGVKFNTLIQSLTGEIQEQGEKKAKNNSRLQKNSENLEKKSEDSQTQKINSKEIQEFVKKTQGIETVSITEKLKRSEPNLKKEREQTSPQVPNQASETHVVSKEKSNLNLQVPEPKAKIPDPKAEVRGSVRPQELARNFQEIVKAAKFQIVENGKNSAEILLQPKELGRVTLFVSEENSRLEGKIFVETDSAKLMILSELQNLKADLKTSGLELFELTVDIRDENSMKFSSSEDKKGSDEGTGYAGRGTGELNPETETESSSLSPDRILDIMV